MPSNCKLNPIAVSLLTLILLSLSGCTVRQDGPTPSHKFDTLSDGKKLVREGMTMSEVEDLLGVPDFISDFTGKLRNTDDVGKGVEIEYHYRRWVNTGGGTLGDLTVHFHKSTGKTLGAIIKVPD